MVEVLTGILQRLSCLISYTFLLYGALLTVVGFFSIKCAIDTVPAAFGVMFFHFLLQGFLLRVPQEEIVISLATDLLLIILGLLPGIILREENISASLVSFAITGCLMLFWIYPSIVSRC